MAATAATILAIAGDTRSAEALPRVGRVTVALEVSVISLVSVDSVVLVVSLVPVRELELELVREVLDVLVPDVLLVVVTVLLVGVTVLGLTDVEVVETDELVVVVVTADPEEVATRADKMRATLTFMII